MSENEAGVDETDRTTIELPVGVASHSSTVSSAHIGTSFTIGRLTHDDSQALVPFMTCELNGTFAGDECERTVRTTMTFDNVAFLIKRFAEEYLEAVETFEMVSRGGIALSEMRADLTIRWLQEGATALAAASREIAELQQRRRTTVTPSEDEGRADEPEPLTSPRRKNRALGD